MYHQTNSAYLPYGKVTFEKHLPASAYFIYSPFISSQRVEGYYNLVAKENACYRRRRPHNYKYSLSESTAESRKPRLSLRLFKNLYHGEYKN